MTISTALFRPKSVAKVGILAAALLTLHAGESQANTRPPLAGGDFSCRVVDIIEDQASIGIIPGYVPKCNGGDRTVGDKVLSEFDFSGLSITTTDTMSFSRIPNSLGYQFQYNFLPILPSPFAGSFSYRVTITPEGLAAGNTFEKVQANITGNIQTNGTFITSVSTNPAINPIVIQASSNNIAPNQNPSVDAFFGPGVTTALFTQSFSLAGLPQGASVVNSLGLTLTQKTTSVPGPLPILGAGAAFGFSRKLRRRVRQVA
jgi:hypothetical protein